MSEPGDRTSTTNGEAQPHGDGDVDEARDRADRLHRHTTGSAEPTGTTRTGDESDLDDTTD